MNEHMIIALVESLFAARNGAPVPAPLAADATEEQRGTFAAAQEAHESAVSAVLAEVDIDLAETSLRSFADVILDNPDSTSEDYETAATLADAVDMIVSEREVRARAQASVTAQRDEIKARLAGGTVTASNDGDGNGDDAATAGGDGADGDAGSGDGSGGGDAGDGGTGSGDGGEGAGEPAATTSATTEPAAAAPAAPVPAPLAQPTLSGLAAAERRRQEAVAGNTIVAEAALAPTAMLDVPGVSPGGTFDSRAKLVEAVMGRMEVLGNSRGGGVGWEKVPIARFSYLDKLRTLSESDRLHNEEIFRDIMDGGPNAITASGGFCAPAMPIYNFVKINKPVGLMQDMLPTVGATRGQVSYPTSPDIRDAFTLNPSRAYSNQNDIDGVHKVVSVISCPSFHTCVVGAQYEILQFGNFGTKAFPEWVDHWLGLVLDVHAHKVSAKLIGQMVAFSNAAVAVGPNGGATSTCFSNFALAAADYRQDLRMEDDAPLEILLPIWFDDLIRSDLFRARKGTDWSQYAITDTLIASWFATLNLVPRYVVDWQDVSGNNRTGAIAWPQGLNFLVYAPGTFVKLDMGTLDLGVVRDSVLNITNDYTIFSESFESVCMPGLEARNYSVSICANGAFSADQNLGCNGIDIPGS